MWLEPNTAAIAMTSSTPVVDEASPERAALMAILSPLTSAHTP